MPHAPHRASARPLTEWPGYWFLLLDNFLAEGDLEAAAEAKRQLDRLGVEVRYRAICQGHSPTQGQDVDHPR